MHQNGENNFTDRDLVSRALTGDTRAFGQIVRNTERLVAQVIFKMVDKPEDRKDLAQDAFLKAYRNLSGFRFESKLSTWIARIAYHTCLDYLKKKNIVTPAASITGSNEADDDFSIGGELADDQPDPVRNKEPAGILDREIRKLSPIYQTLIVLYHKEDCSYEEIAEITSLPMGTIKNYLFRARKELKNNMLRQYKKEEL